MQCFHSPSVVYIRKIEVGGKWSCLERTTIEHKTVDSDLLISRNADLGKQILSVAKSTQSGNDPAIANRSLANVIGGHAINVELGVLEDVLERD